MQAGEWRLLLSSWAAELLSLLVFKGQAGSGEEVAAPSQEELSLDISQLLCPQADTRPLTEPFPQSLCFAPGLLGFADSFLSKQDSLFISGQTAERSEGWGPTMLIGSDRMRRSCFQELGWSLMGGGRELAQQSVLSLLPLD